MRCRRSGDGDPRLLSDLLSPETVEAMRARRADLEVLEIPDQGHAPLLDDEATLRKIEGLVHRCDEAKLA